MQTLDSHREESHVKTEAETRVMFLQAKKMAGDCQSRRKEGSRFSRRPSEGTNSTKTCTSAF